MSIPINKALYEQVKIKADTIYKKPSAYKSGYIVQEYKRQGGKYRDDKTKKEKPLQRWFSEKWVNVNPNQKGYAVLRPSIRVNKNTPTLSTEIPKENLKQQIKLKQKIKGSKNLPPFKKKK